MGAPTIAETEGAGTGELRYAAFISYAHEDERFAAKLHRRLERYRLPKPIVPAGRTARLGKVFRDRSDLAAATSLSDAICDALRQSSALIVLCSPASVASHWVNEEVRLFRALSPDAPILPVIVAGDDPAAVMPASLTEGGLEPLAADFRKDGDGGKLAFLKVVAALAAVPLDALIQRDAQRRLRNVMTLTGLIVAVMLVMATMTMLAISARREAERQRAAAEGLVEYMLTDLRDDLVGVGRLDVRSRVYNRAMAFYAGQGDLRSLPEDSLKRRARVLMAMGDDELDSGDLRSAARRFDEARRTSAALLAASPDEPDNVFVHAQSEYWAGEVALRRDQTADARRHWLAYRTLARRLAALEPASDRALLEQAYAEGNLCNFQVLTEDDEFAGSCDASLRFFEQNLAQHPDDVAAMRQLANRRAWNADLAGQRGDFAAQRVNALAALGLARRILAQDPANRGSQEFLVGMLIAASEAHIRDGRMDAARPFAREGEERAAALVRHDPANDRWQELRERIARSTRYLATH